MTLHAKTRTRNVSSEGVQRSEEVDLSNIVFTITPAARKMTGGLQMEAKREREGGRGQNRLPPSVNVTSTVTPP